MFIEKLTDKQIKEFEKILRKLPIYLGNIEKEQYYIEDNYLVFIHCCEYNKYGVPSKEDIDYSEMCYSIFSDKECVDLKYLEKNSLPFFQANVLWKQFLIKTFPDYNQKMSEINMEEKSQKSM